MADKHKESFKIEAKELLAELETTLLELERNKDNFDLINKAFRALHTIKGSAGMFDYDNISMFTHDIENLFDKIRNGEVEITKQIIDLTLMAKDQISLMLEDTETEKFSNDEIVKNVIISFKELSDLGISVAEESGIQKDKVKVEAKSSLYFIKFIPSKEIFVNGTNPIYLINELTGLGEAIVKADTRQIPDLKELITEYCYIGWKLLLSSTKSLDTIRDVFIFVEDLCEIEVEKLDIKEDIASNKELFSILNSELDFDSFSVENILAKAEKIIVELQDSEQIPAKEIKVSKKEITTADTDTKQSVRINAEKLDELVNLVGELVIVQARLSQTVSRIDDSELANISEEVERLTWELRDSALNIRMLPIGTTFNKFKRLVRDLAYELGKEVELTTEGAETELDKTVIEKLNDPLVHIIRNAIDHGIEEPEKRVALGKQRKGSINLSASQSGGNVIIKISDDGAGIDKEKIKEKALSLGLISEGIEYKESDIFSLIFHPGFSLAKKITSVSGRGVGMDVVKKAIEGLRGTVEVESELGKGTTIILKLPLTLAIIDGLLVEISNNFYVLPLSSVEECVELSRKDTDKMHGRNIINIRGELIPFIKLRERFFIDGEAPEIEQVVIVDIKGNRVGFVVDKVVGQHQTVLKTLGKIYKSVNDISGATILGDGTVALIIDVQKLAEQQELEEREKLK